MQFAQSRLRYYTLSLHRDLPAGMVLFLLALPLSLGVALASGAPLVSGMISAIIGGLIVSWISGSQLSVSGPAAGLSFIVLHEIGDVGGFEPFLLAVLISGLIQIVLGLLKAGVLSAFLPSSVIRGMMVAIGIILIIRQIPHAIGTSLDLMGEETFFPMGAESSFLVFEEAFASIALGPTTVALGSLLILSLWDSPVFGHRVITRMIPGGLIVVSWGILFHFLSIGTPFEIKDVHLVNLPEFTRPSEVLDYLSFPDFSRWLDPGIYSAALTIAVLGSLESLLSLEAVDKLDPLKRVAPPNRELLAQGIGNLLSALIGGLPLTAVIVRSSANVDAGGRTKVACFFHGVLLLLSFLFFARWLNFIPLSALAAILVYTGFKLCHPRHFMASYREGRDRLIPFLITIFAIITTDLLIGIAIGLTFGIYYVFKANSNRAISLTRNGPHYLIRFRKDVSFINKPLLRGHLASVEPESHLIIDGSRAEFIDMDIIETIDDYLKASSEDDITVTLRNIRGLETPQKG